MSQDDSTRTSSLRTDLMPATGPWLAGRLVRRSCTAIRTTGLSLVIAGVAMAPAFADFPHRKAGLWEIQSAASKAAGLSPAQLCVGDNTDTRASHLDHRSGPRGACTLSPFLRRGDAWLAESVCRRRKTVITSRKIATGDFKTHYRIDTVLSVKIGKRKRPDTRDALVARYLGACKPEHRNNDLITPGMGTLNMTDGKFQAEKKRRKK